MARVSTLNAEKERAGAWYGELFQSYENLPFSFRIGETAYHGFNDDFPFVSKETSSERISKKHAEYEIRKMVLTARHKSGVEVKAECAYYPEYAVFEWVLHFRNTGEENSPAIRCVNAADLDFSGSEPVLEYFLGDDSADQKAMKPERVDLNTGLSMEFGAVRRKTDKLSAAVLQAVLWRHRSRNFRGLGRSVESAFRCEASDRQRAFCGRPGNAGGVSQARRGDPHSSYDVPCL